MAVAPPHAPAGEELVANCSVDDVLVQVFPEINVTAPAQLSFAGCAYVKIGMQKKERTISGIQTNGIRTAMDFIGWTLALQGLRTSNRHKPNRSDKVINHKHLTQ